MDGAPPEHKNGAQSLGELMGRIADRLDAIEARMAKVETAASPEPLNVGLLISRSVAGLVAVAVVVGAVLGKVDLTTALAFAGGLGFAMPGMLPNRGGQS